MSGDQASNCPSLDEFEAVFVNNADMLKIQTHLNKFNPLRTMKMERMEIRHSAILGWLFSPLETHGLGDRFLKGFLCEALRGQSALGKPTALDVAQADMRDAFIRTEWQKDRKRLDILVISERNGWAFIIENKVGSSQRHNQLSDYMKKVKSAYRDSERPPTVRGVFLTLTDEDPEDGQYAPVNYSAVCSLLASIMELEGANLSPEVRVFLNHYLEVVREATGMNEETNELRNLAKKLYREHKRVLDFVFENGATTNFASAAKDLFGETTERNGEVEIEGSKFVFERLKNNEVYFLPLAWHEALKKGGINWAGCENWWAGLPLIAWFEFRVTDDGGGRLSLGAAVGPISDHEKRRAMIERIRNKARGGGNLKIGFQQNAARDGRRYSRFFRQNSTRVDDAEDHEKIADEMRKLLKKFRAEFDLVSNALTATSGPADGD